MGDWPDLSRTEVAVAAFDDRTGTGREVGEAFALDTADRNNFETTAALVRPGNARPAHPDNESFLGASCASGSRREGHD